MMRSLYAAFALLLLGCEQTPPPQAPPCGCSPPAPTMQYVQEKKPNADGHFHLE